MNTLVLILAFSIPEACSYLIWKSRWNIPAHLGAAFSLVAFGIPLTTQNPLDDYDPDLVTRFTVIMAFGAVSYLLGMLFSSLIWDARSDRRKTCADEFGSGSEYERLRLLSVLGSLLGAYAISRLGYLAVFADDPLSAKFFRGAYSDLYSGLAVPFRLGTTLMAMLLPLMICFCLRKGRDLKLWWILTLVSVAILGGMLLRGSLAFGIVLLLMVILIDRDHAIIAGITGVVTYIGGGLLYFVLNALGLSRVQSSPEAGSGVLSQVASTIPDVTDALTFFDSWVSRGANPTLGKTFLGGLVPGNYRWNPAVWSVTFGDPSVDLNSIASGGLRLPPQIWGFVAFGIVGTVFVCFLSGALAGILILILRDSIQQHGIMTKTWLLVGFYAASAVIPEFYAMTYVGVVQFGAFLWISRPWWGRRKAELYRANQTEMRAKNKGVVRRS